MKSKTEFTSYIVALILALSFGSLAAAAQEKPASHKAITATGCLQKGDEPGEYSITSDDGKRYGLRSKTVALAKHVGHKVTVTGIRVREQKEQAKKSGEGENADLRVTKLKMISESCK
jgi:hypothetical protein